jgi:effector-binding domain-containing protein
MVVKEFGGTLNIPAAATGAQKNAAKKSNRKIEKEAEDAGVIPDKKAPTTIFYQIVDIKDESKVYFEIEFRLDGDSHPPQLKTGKGIMSL